MTKSKLTKKALLCSILTILLSTTMLIGTTFAWFTDTASTSVNKIQAGTLTVDIVKDDGTTSIKDKSMDFVDYNSSADILWEPGVTFKTPVFKIKSTGNLALKYKLVLNGVNGDNELLDVIKFSVIDETGNEVDLDTYVGHLTSDEPLSGALYIKAHMDEEAGNKYQGKSLEGLGITVVATQDTVEYDSYEKTYDEDAKYPVYATATKKVTVKGETGNKSVAAAVTLETKEKAEESTATTKPSIATAVVPVDTKLEDNATSLNLVVKEDTTDANIKVDTSTEAAKTFEVHMDGLDNTNNTSIIKVTLYVGEGLGEITLYHNENPMEKDSSAAAVTQADHYYYDNSTGIVTMAVNKFSPFTIVYISVATDEEFAAVTDKTNKVININSSKLLYKFAQNVNSGISYNGYTINLTADIDLGGANWTPINAGGSAGIIFNGCNHTIKNGKIKTTSGAAGFFNGNVYVSNLTFDNFTVSSTDSEHGAAVVYGSVSGATGPYTVKEDLTIENVNVKNSLITGAKYTGAIIGYGNGNINVKNCNVENTVVSGQYKAGGAIGYICCCSKADFNVQVTGNTLTSVTVKGENLVSGKSDYVLGKIIGNWCVPNGACKNNTFTGETNATDNIGQKNNVTSIDEG